MSLKLILIINESTDIYRRTFFCQRLFQVVREANVLITPTQCHVLLIGVAPPALQQYETFR